MQPELEVCGAHGFEHGPDQNVDFLFLVVGHHLDAEARPALRHRRVFDQIGDGAEVSEIARGDAGQAFRADPHRHDGGRIAKGLHAGPGDSVAQIEDVVHQPLATLLAFRGADDVKAASTEAACTGESAFENVCVAL